MTEAIINSVTETVVVSEESANVIEVITPGPSGPAGPAGGSANLQAVTDEGSQTTNNIVLLDSQFIILDENGVQVGKLAQAIDPDFGLILRAETVDGARDKRLTLTGSNLLLGAEQIEMALNGAEDGNVLRIVGKKDVQGNDVFVVTSTPADLTENEQDFTSTTDLVLTASYQTAINGLTNYDYRPDTSFGDTSIYIENDNPVEAVVEVGLAVGAAVPAQTALYTIPRKQGAQPGFRRIATHDTFTTDLNIGDDIHARIRVIDGAAEVKGSVDQTAMKLVQVSNVSSPIQASRSVAAPVPTNIDTGESLRLTEPGGVYVFPQASLRYNPSRPVEIELYNASGDIVILDSFGADSLSVPGGPQNLYQMSAGEATRWRCQTGNTWELISASSNLLKKRILALGESATNAQYNSSPVTIASQNIDLPYTWTYQSISFDLSNTATNRSTILGLFIDGIEVERVEIEPKDSRNIHWPSKQFDKILSTGSHLFEIKLGKGNGGGGSMAKVNNVRWYIEEFRL